MPFILRAALAAIAAGTISGSALAQTQPKSPQFVSALPEAPSPQSTVQSPMLPREKRAAGAQLTGTVSDQAGSLISNAMVTLSNEAGDVHATQHTAADGRFTFRALEAGAYSLAVSSTGFEGFMAPAILIATGQSIDLDRIELFIAPETATVTVSASKEEVAAAQVQLAEKQRVLGVIPNFYSSYIWDAAPLTSKLKFNLAFRSTADPVTLLITAGLAGIEQAHNTFPGYGPGPKGYAERFGAAYADNVIGRMLGSAILPSLFHQDPRYFYKGHGSITSRALYAIGATVIARGDNGRSQPNYSHLLGNFAAAGLANLYRTSSDRNAALTVRNGFIITGSNAVANLVREFLLRQITSKVPDYTQGKVSP